MGCSSLERTKFNSNLVRVFTEEYDRSIRIFPTVAPSKYLQRTSPSQQTVHATIGPSSNRHSNGVLLAGRYGLVNMNCTDKTEQSEQSGQDNNLSCNIQVYYIVHKK